MEKIARAAKHAFYVAACSAACYVVPAKYRRRRRPRRQAGAPRYNGNACVRRDARALRRARLASSTPRESAW